MTITDDPTLLDYPAARAQDRPLDPPPALLELLDDSPITKVRIEDGTWAWLVTGYEEQRAVMAHPAVSADSADPRFPSKVRGSQSGPGFFITMDDPEHARLRRMLTRPFLIKNVEALRPSVQRITDGLIDKMLASPTHEADLMEAFALPLPSLVICELLGVAYEDHDFFQENSALIMSRTDPTGPQRGYMALAGFMMKLVEKKMAEPGDDLTTTIAEQVKAGALTLPEAGGMGMLMLFAGHETTANQIALSTVALLEHPDQLALLQRDDNEAVSVTAVEELLRYLNIAHTGRRRLALEDVEVAGVTIRAGEGVVLSNDVGNRDASAFPDPQRLDITRDASHHIAFGYGAHQCLGQPLARVELQVVYRTLFRRIPTLKLAVPATELEYKHDMTVFGLHQLPVTW